MTCVGQERAYGTRTLKVRDGRISDLRVSCSRVRLSLQAVVRRFAHYVGLTSSSGHSDVAFDVYGVGFAAVPKF